VCGRLNVSDSPLSEWVSELLGIPYQAHSNDDLCPTQTAAAIVSLPEPKQLDLTWGIQPNWAKRILINAQAETVAEKPTFRDAFRSHRCLIPCDGWYEWRSEAGQSRKQKYLFSALEAEPLLMAAICYPEAQGGRFVTLTTSANACCQPYHHRMPLLISQKNALAWLQGDTDKVAQLLIPDPDQRFNVTAT